MVMTATLPTALQPCETCGHQPEPAKRLRYLAGCPDDHRFEMQFNILHMQDEMAHLWPDQTYSAIRLGHGDAQTILAWLDACHAGRTPRRLHVLNEQIVFDEAV